MIARKRFGQHFLSDTSVVDSIIDALDVKQSDAFVEIGPGMGQVTQPLLAAGADVSAVEIDRDLARSLRSEYPELDLIEEDVLQVPVSLYTDKRVVGNLPYNISTPMLLKICDAQDVVDVHFMLQKEVAQRLEADVGTKSWGRLSVHVRYSFEVFSLFDVEPQSFRPEPRVMSTFVKLQPFTPSLVISDRSVFDEIVRVAFGQRRKKISNSLRSFNVDWHAISVDGDARADQLDVADYVALANWVS